MVSKLSVVIPTHNRAAMLDEALASVLRSQLVSAENVIVVCDDVVDATPEVVSRHSVRRIIGKFGNPSRTRNAGLAVVDTEFVAFLDDDDEWLPGNCEPQLVALQRDRRAGFAFGYSRLTDPQLNETEIVIPGAIPAAPDASFFWSNHVQLGAVVFRSEALRTIGGFDEALTYWEDSELYLRALTFGPAAGVQVVGSRFRQRDWNPGDAATRFAVLKARGEVYKRHRQALEHSGLARWHRRYWEAELHYRGRLAGYCIWDAREFWRRSERKMAVGATARAFRLSPAHALVVGIRS